MDCKNAAALVSKQITPNLQSVIDGAIWSFMLRKMRPDKFLASVYRHGEKKHGREVSSIRLSYCKLMKLQNNPIFGN